MENEEDLKRPVRKIYRSRTDRIVFGVCGGIAAYYSIESLWVRVVFIFLGITGAIGLLLYLALALLMPVDPRGQNSAARESHGVASTSADATSRDRRNMLGLVIVTVGVIAFFNTIFPGFWIGWKIVWPIVIILIGFSFISN